MSTETLSGASYSSPTRPVWSLLAVRSPDSALRDTRIPLRGSELVVGREPDGGLRVADPRMSRRHARLVRTPGQDSWLVEDMGSKNGVQVGGASASAHVLEDGDVVRMGDTLFACEHHPEALPPLVERPVFAGTSAAVRLLLQEARLAAGSRASVLLHGETGSGKDVLARSLHEWSGRLGPLVPLNCAAIPSQLVESTLFGHRRGAFTGAVEHNDGTFVAADRGTLFLDEVAELSAAAQAALLRVLEDRVVTPVGGTRGRSVDVRVIAATHVDLSRAVEEGRFRADLRTRLAGWTLRIAPLRDRPADIQPLIEAFLPRGLQLTPDVTEALLVAPWPGNARELRSVLTRAEAYASDGVIGLDALPEELAGPIRRRSTAPAAEVASARPDEQELRQVIAWAGGNIARVAERYGRTRKQIYRWIERYGIDLDELRPG
jgi:DNA-binding NtrC family response regulator